MHNGLSKIVVNSFNNTLKDFNMSIHETKENYLANLSINPPQQSTIDF